MGPPFFSIPGRVDPASQQCEERKLATDPLPRVAHERETRRSVVRGAAAETRCWPHRIPRICEFDAEFRQEGTQQKLYFAPLMLDARLLLNFLILKELWWAL
jgi:hypothetical protein